MSNEVMKISEKSVMPFITPKQADLIALIGEDNLKRETSFAIQAVNANSYLSQATPASVAKAIWNVGITGLSLNPVLKLAYITPRKVGQNVEAILMPSYQGLVKLITDTGSVKQVYAHCVFEGDEFEVILGGEYSVKHIPKFKSDKVTHAYAVGVLHDGTRQYEVMGIDQINVIRDMSDGWKAFKANKASSAIWDTWDDEMARKTVIKRLTKYLPKTDKWEQVGQAIEVDNSIYPASLQQVEYIHRLIDGSGYDDERKRMMHGQIEAGITNGEASELIERLNLNQVDPIDAGLPYNQGDITNKLQQQL